MAIAVKRVASAATSCVDIMASTASTRTTKATTPSGRAIATRMTTIGLGVTKNSTEMGTATGATTAGNAVRCCFDVLKTVFVFKCIDYINKLNTVVVLP